MSVSNVKHDHRIWVPRIAFSDHVAQPAEHRRENERDTRSDRQEQRAMKKMHRAEGEDEPADGADDGPWARVYEMIVVMFGVGVSHVPSSDRKSTRLNSRH